MEKALKILVIEDDEFVKMFLKDMFLIFGKKHECGTPTIVSTADKAEEYLAATTPDLVLLDLSFPPKEGERASVDSGFSILNKIKSDDSLKQAKVLIFTGYSDDELKLRAKNMGADYFLIKGEYLPKDLLKIIMDVRQEKPVKNA